MAAKTKKRSCSAAPITTTSSNESRPTGSVSATPEEQQWIVAASKTLGMPTLCEALQASENALTRAGGGFTVRPGTLALIRIGRAKVDALIQGKRTAA